MRLHITALFKILEPLLAHEGAWRVRGVRFTQYGLQQKVSHDVYERILKGGADPHDTRPVIVAFGDAKFKSQMPIKRTRNDLRRRGVEVWGLNEDYSSQLCSLCWQKLVPMYAANNGGAIHAVRRCLTPACSCTVWNRDRNAANNMFTIFWLARQLFSRPMHFTQQYQRSVGRAR